MSKLYAQVIACFDRDPYEAMETYPPEILLDYLGVDEVFEVIKMGHLDFLDCLTQVVVDRGGPDENCWWQLIASGVAQHQSVAVLEQYGAQIPLGLYLRDCVAPFQEEFFTVLPQYVSTEVVCAASEEMAAFFQMVQQKHLLLKITEHTGGSLKKKM